jgi:hypothetical protein
MSCITEIQEAIVVVITTAPCISVIYDICNCKSHHHMIMTTTTPYISAIYVYYWNTGGHRGRDHMVVWFTIYNYICHILLKYKRPLLSWSYGGVIYNYLCHILLKYKGPSWSWSYGGVIYNYICHILLKYKGPSWSWSYGVRPRRTEVWSMVIVVNTSVTQ